MPIKFLVVDDSKVMRQMVIQAIFEGRIFKRENSLIWEAADGVEALDIFKSQSPNIVLTDWNMPNMDGYDLAKEIRKLNKHVPVVMITEEGASEMQEKATARGLVTAYIIKPLTAGVLEEKLMAALGINQ